MPWPPRLAKKTWMMFRLMTSRAPPSAWSPPQASPRGVWAPAGTPPPGEFGHLVFLVVVLRLPGRQSLLPILVWRGSPDYVFCSESKLRAAANHSNNWYLVLPDLRTSLLIWVVANVTPTKVCKVVWDLVTQVIMSTQCLVSFPKWWRSVREEAREMKDSY